MREELKKVRDARTGFGVIGDRVGGVGDGAHDLFLDVGGRVGDKDAGEGIWCGFGHFDRGVLEGHYTFVRSY